MTAPTQTAPMQIPIQINFDPAAFAKGAETTLAEVADAKALTIQTDAEAAIVAEYLREKMREKDAVTKMQKDAIRPLDQVKKMIRSWFKPTLDAFAEIECLCKDALGGFRIRQEAAKRAAIEAAQQAAAAHDVPALLPALAAASAPITKQDGVGVRVFWKATVINPGLLMPEWTLTIPNQEKIDAHAARFASDQTPDPIPGVRFELETQTSVRR